MLGLNFNLACRRVVLFQGNWNDNELILQNGSAIVDPDSIVVVSLWIMSAPLDILWALSSARANPNAAETKAKLIVQ